MAENKNVLHTANEQTASSEVQGAEPSNRMTRILLRIFASFTVLGILWIFVLVDFVSISGKVEPKDYAAEEVENLKRVQQEKDGMRISKLIDENATQYVNEVTEEEPMEEVPDEIIPPEPEEELIGEEF